MCQIAQGETESYKHILVVRGCIAIPQTLFSTLLFGGRSSWEVDWVDSFLLDEVRIFDF